MNDETDNGNKFPPGNPGDPGYYAPPEERYDEAQQQEAPAVSAPAAKNFVFLGVFALVIVGIVYFFFSGHSEKTDVSKKSDQAYVPPKPAQQAIIPPAPPIPSPPAPPTPPTPVAQNTPSPTLFQGDSPEHQKRIQSEMVISKGGIFGSTDLSSGTKNPVNDNDPNVGFADGFYNQQDAPFAQARKLGDTGRLIEQGKIIESVLETPINTDVPGMIRAVVSHDIYAESGRVILIPKGSRLVGTYNNFVIRGNKRVNVIWSRVIRPDGIDIMIRSGGADQLGRAGVEGDVDNKYSEIFASAFLVSAINIAVGIGVDAVDKTKSSTTTNTDGSTTSNSDAKNQAAIQAVDMFGNTGQNLIDSFLNQKPTITIDQGTRVNVFVNRDLIFPSNVGGQVTIVQ